MGRRESFGFGVEMMRLIGLCAVILLQHAFGHNIPFFLLWLGPFGLRNEIGLVVCCLNPQPPLIAMKPDL